MKRFSRLCERRCRPGADQPAASRPPKSDPFNRNSCPRYFSLFLCSVSRPWMEMRKVSISPIFVLSKIFRKKFSSVFPPGRPEQPKQPKRKNKIFQGFSNLIWRKSYFGKREWLALAARPEPKGFRQQKGLNPELRNCPLCWGRCCNKLKHKDKRLEASKIVENKKGRRFSSTKTFLLLNYTTYLHLASSVLNHLFPRAADIMLYHRFLFISHQIKKQKITKKIK